MTIGQNNMSMPTINVKDLHFAKLIREDREDVTKTEYDTPIWFEGVRQIGIKPKTQSTPITGDGRKISSLAITNTIDVVVDCVGLTFEQEAYLLGRTITEDGTILYKDTDFAPFVAMMFRSPLAPKNGVKTGAERFTVLYAGQFRAYDSDQKQIEDGKISPSYMKLTGTFSPLSNGLYESKFDSTNPSTTQDKIDNFFKKVYIPTPKKVVSEESH